jgi:hypothetical protein
LRFSMSRLTRLQVYLIVAAQLLLAVPAMSSAFVASAAESAACGGMAPDEHGDHCPCCPDGITTMTDCLASCTLAAAIPAGWVVSDPVSIPLAPSPEPPTLSSYVDDPPPEPPPIR